MFKEKIFSIVGDGVYWVVLLFPFALNTQNLIVLFCIIKSSMETPCARGLALKVNSLPRLRDLDDPLDFVLTDAAVSVTVPRSDHSIIIVLSSEC